MNGITLNSLYDFVHSVGFCSNVPMFPVKKHILINSLYVPHVYQKILERHAPIGMNKKVGTWEQNLETIDIKGLNTFPLYFPEGEHYKKEERYAITA